MKNLNLSKNKVAVVNDDEGLNEYLSLGKWYFNTNGYACSGSKAFTNKRKRNGDIASSYLHQVVWIYYNGEIPVGMEIDHIDGDKLNDQIENLRLATRSENISNNRKRTGNYSSIYKGFIRTY